MGDQAGIEQPVDTGAVDTPPVDAAPAVEADNPAWAPFLEGMPEQLYPMLKSRLRESDKNVQQMVSKVHSEYEDYKPYKEAGLSRQQIDAALQFYQLADSDPEALWKQMGNYYGYNSQQQGQQPNSPAGEVDLGSDEDGQQQQFDPFADPRIQQLAQQQQAIQQQMIAAHNAEVQRNADAEIDSWITAQQTQRGGKEKFNDDTMDFILNRAMAEASRTGDYQKAIGNAFAAYDSFVGQVRSAPRVNDSAPLVMPTGGGVPIVGKNPADLTDAERRNLGAQMIQQAMRES